MRRDAGTKMKKTEKSHAGWWFLVIVGIIYIAIAFIDWSGVVASLSFFIKITVKLVPLFISIFVLMSIINCFISNKFLLKWLGSEAGIKGWLVSIIGGIISIGPIYMWYPLLSDLQEKKAKEGFIATFLYNRAVKPALLPLLIYYFGWIYTLVLTVIMIFASIAQGVIVEKIMEVRK